MIISQIDKIGNNFQKAYRVTLYFKAAISYSLYLSSLSLFELKSDSEFEKNIKLKPEILNCLEKFNKYHSFFKSPEEVGKVIIEKTFIDKYQVFESLIYDLIFLLYQNFPNFLNNGDASTSISIKDIYSKDNIEDLRNIVIENRTRHIIQFNSIKSVLHQIEKIFGIKLNISKDDLNQIYLISRLRNLITHNKSILNETVLKELLRENISIILTVGQDIIPYVQDNDEIFSNVLFSVGNEIIVIIKKNIKQITNYHNSKL